LDLFLFKCSNALLFNYSKLQGFNPFLASSFNCSNVLLFNYSKPQGFNPCVPQGLDPFSLTPAINDYPFPFAPEVERLGVEAGGCLSQPFPTQVFCALLVAVKVNTCRVVGVLKFALFNFFFCKKQRDCVPSLPTGMLIV
jgi:hypothetical protein